MVSVLTAIVIALVVFAVAVWKGRTGWHWFVLSLLGFAVLWLLTAVVLHFSQIRISIATADRRLATFVGPVTAAVMLIIVTAAPSRPRRRHHVPGPPAGLAERRPRP